MYKQKGIKYKKALQKRVKNHEQPAEPVEIVRNLREELLEVEEDEPVEIFQVDESVFLGCDGVKKAWSPKHKNIVVPCTNQAKQQSAKVIAAISNKGTMFYMIKPGYFNQEDVVKFLMQIKAGMGRRRWGVFWDNCPTHKARKVRDYLERHYIPTVMNIPYCPRFNGIESMWGI